MTTWTPPCPHGELWAVCRECPPDTDPLRAPGTDDEPHVVRDFSLAALAALVILAIARLVGVGR